ncbi:hypothetical protein ACIBO1_09425 [Micromonospora sp. NPDC049903]|uniref:hypothetical protein n=1 Tax=Micromonospora sp. NPDC049903 TaxID=3364276 RepID=UPI0037875399
MAYPRHPDEAGGPPSHPFTVPGPAAAYPGMPPPHRKNQNVVLWIVGAVVCLLLLCCGIGVGGVLLYAFRSNQVADSTASPPTTPQASTAAPTTTPPSSAAAPALPDTFETITEGQWRRVAERPDDHTGRTLVVYGQITQFDDATGEDRFLALVGARRTTDDGGYDTNTMLYGDPKVLGDIAADDEFQAKVTVLKAYTYQSLVGPTKVPLLLVHSLRVL